jgi:hypothetical protein
MGQNFQPDFFAISIPRGMSCGCRGSWQTGKKARILPLLAILDLKYSFSAGSVRISAQARVGSAQITRFFDVFGPKSIF